MQNIKKLSEYVKKTHPTLPMTAIYLAIYCHFSELLCFNRVKIETPLFSVFPNIYGITFMPSNSGKDYIKKIISEVTEFEENKELECEKIYFNQLEELKIKAEDLDITKQSKEKYIRDNEPRQMVTDSSNATIEGMLAMREAMSDVNIGHCNFSHSEFGKFISNKNNSSDILLTYLMEAYDGDTKAKIIQGKKKVKPIKGVPQTMFVHSSITGFIDNEKATNELKSFLETGLGRRSFLCFPSSKEFGEPIDVSENFIEYYAELEKEKNELKDIFREIYKTIKAKLNNYKDIYANIYKKMTFSDDAFKYYLKYRYDCQIKGKNCISELKGEIEGRHWKTIRLSGVCAIIEGKDFIDLDSIKTAITVAEGYGKQIENFYKSIDLDVLRDLFEFILKNPNSSKTDVRNSGFFINKKDTRFIDQCLIDLENYCYDKGYNLITDIKLNKYKYYSIIKQEEEKILIDILIEEENARN